MGYSRALLPLDSHCGRPPCLVVIHRSPVSLSLSLFRGIPKVFLIRCVLSIELLFFFTKRSDTANGFALVLVGNVEILRCIIANEKRFRALLLFVVFVTLLPDKSRNHYELHWIFLVFLSIIRKLQKNFKFISSMYPIIWTKPYEKVHIKFLILDRDICR